jgi:hypothetical protein
MHRGPRIKAFMAKPAVDRSHRTFAENDKSVICADCGASTTIARSLANTADVVEKETIADMAESGARMKATHTCMKTYFITNRTGDSEVVTITTQGLYVWNVHQDLLSGKACNRAMNRIVLDLDQDIAGLYPLDKEKQSWIRYRHVYMCIYV